MSSTLVESECAPSAPAASLTDSAAIKQCVQFALASPQPERQLAERRREKRHPYPYPIYLTPVDRAGRGRLGTTIIVVGKHLSDHGLDFYCREPLPYRRVIASLPCGNGWVGLLLDLSWCRFSRHGWYDNGGRFLAAIRSPLEDPDERALLDL